MSKYVKDLVQKELENRFKDVADFLVLSTKGVGGNDNNEMRGALKEKGIKLSVVKNVIMRRSLEKMDLAAAASLFMAGPCTVAYGGDSIVDVAKECSEWAKKIEVISLRGAFVDNSVMDEDGAEALAKMPSRSELLASVVMLSSTPGANVAGAIASPGGIIAGCIKSLVEKLEKEAA